MGKLVARPAPNHLQAVRFLATERPLVYAVEIQLAQNIPACCGISEGAAAEFHAENFYRRIELALEENRTGHLLKGRVTFSKPGAYGYRLTGRILGRPFFQEGVCDVS